MKAQLLYLDIYRRVSSMHKDLELYMPENENLFACAIGHGGKHVVVWVEGNTSNRCSCGQISEYFFCFS